MLDKTGQLPKLLKTCLQSRFAELPERELVLVITNAFKNLIEMIFVEDQFHQALCRKVELTLDISLDLIFGAIVFVLVLVIFVRLLNVGVLFVLGFVVPVFPCQATLLFEALLEFLLGVFQS